MNCHVQKGIIHYETAGEGFPLLILHAMGTDHRSMKAWMEPIFDQLSGFQRVYVDLPAHGKSSITDTFTSTDDSVQNLLDFVNQTFDQKSFALVGSSYGGYLAQGIMHYMPDRAKGICLLAPAVHNREFSAPEKVVVEREDDWFEGVDEDIKAAMETLMIRLTKKNLTHFLAEIQPGRELANREFLTSDWGKERYFLQEEPFSTQELWTQPALFMLGRKDTVAGWRNQMKLMDKFPNGTFAVLEDAGHMLQFDKRELVQSLVRDWLKRLRYSI
ncbi:alpha/beta fold hydrolase [Falsibacillus pallidus]|uniref:Pimeloyl-ACP methyl ester carboxylesterase n=1 Tax=Falsibacillus pallidus TaxID=493781 RepID=A0A370GQF7_9BACI|nr:alpha/beta hydrolase [Falsibacillus pallidus]RDI45741.1 pimeloyl-ACP methyl ester carboxylesterase [Falsibacillus pallidus]